jgi:hypothetical protein
MVVAANTWSLTEDHSGPDSGGTASGSWAINGSSLQAVMHSGNGSGYGEGTPYWSSLTAIGLPTGVRLGQSIGLGWEPQTSGFDTAMFGAPGVLAVKINTLQRISIIHTPQGASASDSGVRVIVATKR